MITIHNFIRIPECSLDKLVRQYAFYIGRPVFTLKDMEIARMNYTIVASSLN